MIRLSEETVTVSATESGWGVVRKTVCKPTGSLDHQTFNTSSMAVLTKSLLCILTMSWMEFDWDRRQQVLKIFDQIVMSSFQEMINFSEEGAVLQLCFV